MRFLTLHKITKYFTFQWWYTTYISNKVLNTSSWLLFSNIHERIKDLIFIIFRFSCVCVFFSIGYQIACWWHCHIINYIVYTSIVNSLLDENRAPAPYTIHWLWIDNIRSNTNHVMIIYLIVFAKRQTLNIIIEIHIS